MKVSLEKDQAYEHFVTKWRGNFAWIMGRFGFRPSDSDFEDVLQDLLLDFFEGDYLALYDPSIASMATFINGFCRGRLMGKRDKRFRRIKREISLNELISQDEENQRTLEEFVAVEDVAFAASELTDAIAQTIAGLDGEKVPGRGRDYDLAWLFGVLVQQVEESGKVDRKVVATRLGVSLSTVNLLISRLREVPAMQEFREALLA